MFQNLNIIKIGIFTIWLFHLSGALGIIYGNTEWFLRFTPLNLLLNSFFLILINLETNKLLRLFIFASIFGFLAELVGVSTGLIFGHYTYGSMLGHKLFDIPIIIGINWAVLVIICSSISDRIFTKISYKIMLSMALMILIDLFMEPVAPKLNYWSFNSGKVSVLNYIGWGVIALPMLSIYQKWDLKTNYYFSLNLYLCQIIFFGLLLIFN